MPLRDDRAELVRRVKGVSGSVRMRQELRIRFDYARTMPWVRQEGTDEDPLLERAIEIVVQTQTASVSLLQRRLRVGYTRAGRLIDMLERRGIISGYEGSKPRRVLVSETELHSV